MDCWREETWCTYSCFLHPKFFLEAFKALATHGLTALWGDGMRLLLVSRQLAQGPRWSRCSADILWTEFSEYEKSAYDNKSLASFSLLTALSWAKYFLFFNFWNQIQGGHSLFVLKTVYWVPLGATIKEGKRGRRWLRTRKKERIGRREKSNGVFQGKWWALSVSSSYDHYDPQSELETWRWPQCEWSSCES